MSIIYQNERYTVVKWTEEGAIIRKTNGNSIKIKLDFETKKFIII